MIKRLMVISAWVCACAAMYASFEYPLEQVVIAGIPLLISEFFMLLAIALLSITIGFSLIRCG